MPLKVVEATWGSPHNLKLIELENGKNFLLWQYVPALISQALSVKYGLPIINKYVVFVDERVSGVIYEELDTYGKVISRYSDHSYQPAPTQPAPTQGLLPPYNRDAYGPGIWSDGTGRPFDWRTRDGQSTGIFDVKPDAYGPGVGMDQFGRPVRARPLW